MTDEKLEPRYCPTCTTLCELDYLGEQAGEAKYRVVTAREAGMAVEMRWPERVAGCRVEAYFVGIGRNAERRERYWVNARICWHCNDGNGVVIPEPLTLKSAGDAAIADPTLPF